MNFIFSDAITACLIKAGWSPSRKVETLFLRKAIEEAGYTWFENASSFLSSFSGLSLISTWLNNSGDVNFDVERAVRVLDPLWVFDDYAARIGKSVFCPIGLAYSSHFILFMSEDGCVYGAFDDFLAYIAPSGLEAIENLLLRKDIAEIP